MAATELEPEETAEVRDVAGAQPDAADGAPATSLWEIGRRFWAVMRPERRLAVASVALTSIAGVFEATALIMLVPLLQRQGSTGTQGLFTPLLEDMGFHGRAIIWASVAGFGLMSLVAIVGRFFGSALIMLVRSRAEADLRKDLTRRLLGMEWSAFLMTRLGDIASSLLMESSQVGAGIQQTLTAVATIFVAAFFVVLAFLLSVKLTALVIGVALAALLVLRPLGRRAEGHTRALSAATQRIARGIADVLGNLKFFRSTGSRARAEALFSSNYDEYAMRFQRTLVTPLAVVLGYELSALVFILILIAVAIHGASTLSATTLVFLGIFLRLTPRMRDLQGGLVLARVQYPWLTKWEQRVATAGAHQARPSGTGTPSFDDRIVADHVSFSFPSVGVRVLDDVSWELRRGEATAFVGESGAGKTTTLDLVSGLLTPTEGRVYIDDTPFTELDVEQWQAHIGLVLDQSPLFHATVRENIVADEEPDDDLVWDSLAAAHADGFVRELPEGLDTVIGERGGRLSGGQRQRLGLARALYRKPWLLILDEATSALDSVSEGVVLEALKGLHGQVSMMIVAHRLVSVRMADRIHVLEAGRIVQSGTWDELLADRAGPFARMAAKQGIVASAAAASGG